MTWQPPAYTPQYLGSGKSGSAWDRNTSKVRSNAERIQPSAYFSRLGIHGYSYEDDGSGTYGNVAGAVLESPIAYLYYLMRAVQYGHQNEIGFALSAAHGSWDIALDNLDHWAQMAAGGTSTRKWQSIAHIQEQQTTEQVVASLRASLPAIAVVPANNGAWRAFTWIPRYKRDGTEHWAVGQIYSATPILPSRYLCTNPEGLAFSVKTTPMGDVLNDLTIEYAYDWGPGEFRRTAHCNALGSDDGYGRGWPTYPLTDVAPTAVAGWSSGNFRYGKKRFPGGKLQLYGVWDPYIATAVGMYFLARFYRTVPIVQFECSPEMIDLQVGHILRFDDELETTYELPTAFWGADTIGTWERASWESVYWLVTHAEFDPVDQRVKATAEWYPQVIGLETFAGAGESGPIGEAGSLAEEF